MGKLVSTAIAGLLFGAGLAVSGMVNPMKVLNFLDLFGAWDATLIAVMGAGLIVTFIGYRIIFRQPRPLFAEAYQLPGTTIIDAKLVGGAVLFGLGWGLSGFCPGPAIASLVFGNAQSVIFVAAMAAGILLTRLVQRGKASEASALTVEG